MIDINETGEDRMEHNLAGCFGLVLSAALIIGGIVTLIVRLA